MFLPSTIFRLVLRAVVFLLLSPVCWQLFSGMSLVDLEAFVVEQERLLGGVVEGDPELHREHAGWEPCSHMDSNLRLNPRVQPGNILNLDVSDNPFTAVQKPLVDN